MKDFYEGEAGRYCADEIKHICSAFGKRSPGSIGERQAMDYLSAQIRKNNWADDVHTQDFRVQPHAFMLFSKVIPILMTIGVALFFLEPIVTLVLASISLFIFVSQFVLYLRVIDFFMPKKKTRNLVAVRSPTGSVKRRIIVSGHIDAAYEWTLLLRLGAILGKTVCVLNFLGVIYILVFGLVITSGAGYHWWMNIPLGIFCLTYLGLIFFDNFHRVVDGANDNLTGTLVSVAVLKHLAEQNIRFEDTEVVALVTSGEEAGLRGAKAFVRRNKKMLRDKSVKTVFIALETLRERKHFAVYSRDMNGLVKHNKSAVALLDRAAAEHFPKPLPHGTVYLGSSDATAFTQGGIPAVMLGAMDPRPAKYYHTRLDTADNLDVASIQKGFDITLEAVKMFGAE